MAHRRVKDHPKRRRSLMPILLMVFAVLVLAFVVERVGLKICKPFVLCWQIRNEVREIEAENARLKQENEELRAKRDQLKTKAGVINEARKLGFVRNGEKIVVEESQPQKNAGDERD